MNPELFSDEFRNFKFLKSSPEDVRYFKSARVAADSIQPWDQPHDPNFHWKSRIEFIEQLLDLRHDTIYIIFAGLISHRNEYEDANIITIENPTVLNGNPIIQRHFCEIVDQDIPSMDVIRYGFSLVEAKHIKDGVFDTTGRIFNVKNLPIIPYPFAKTEFTEMFYDKAEAEKYKIILMEILRKKLAAISSFTNQL